jgi:hypothetical protein
MRKEYRNTIAHGAPMLDIYANKKTGEMVFEFSHASPRGRNRRLAFEELLKVAEDAEASHTEISAAGMAVMTEFVARNLCPLTPPKRVAMKVRGSRRP